jgi:predicted RND superfamily exporter protein
MKRVAAPMVGGLATSFVMELLVYPAIYLLWKRRREVRGVAHGERHAVHERLQEVVTAVLPQDVRPTSDV